MGVLWCWLGAGFGVAGACVVIPCLRSYACWAGLGVLWCWLGAGLGSVGGIATIGAALRRVVGVSGVYGCKTPRVVAWKGQHRVPFRWLCWSCSACLCVFVVVVRLVFVGGLGGIATIGAALRRVVGVSGVYGCKTPGWLLGCAVASPCGGLGLLWWLVVWCLVVCLWCRCGLGRLCWWLGGNCYHRRCFAACRRRVGGLWSQNPRGCLEGPASHALSVAVLVVFDMLRLFVGVVWLVFVGGLGGIATIGAALRRVVGVSVVYGRKTPRVVAWKG